VRSFDATLGDVSGDAFTAFPSTEIIVPNAPVGAAPAATADQIVLVLGDFRGDVGAEARVERPTDLIASQTLVAGASRPR